MPVIPQYRVEGGPPEPIAPTMQRGGGVRVDPTESLQGLDRLAGMVAQGFGDLPNAPQNLGQGVAAGMQNLGEGVRQVGQVQMDIAARVAEINNRVALHAAQVAMEQEYGEFEKWRVNNPDPNQWETEWRQRFGKFADGYLAGKSLPPVVVDAVRQQAETFGARQETQIGVDAVRKMVQMGGESLEAGYLRAVESGDVDTAASFARDGVSLGVWGEDRATMMEIRAKEEIEAKQAGEALNYARAYAQRGMIPEAREMILNSPMPEDEKQVQLAQLDTVAAVEVAKAQVFDRLASGESPDAIRAELEARGEDGSYTAYPELSPAVRAQILKPIYEAANDETTALVEAAASGIGSGVIKDENDLNEVFAGKEIPPLVRADLVKKLKGEVIKTEDNVISLQLEAAKYDPATDPDGRVFTAARNRVALILGDDPRAESVLSVLEKRRRGESLTMPERMRAAKMEEMKSIRDSEAGFKIPANRIKKATKEGVTVYVDTGADIKPDDPNFFETGKGGFMDFVTFGLGGDGEHIKGRIVMLSQDDRIKVDEGKGAVEDLIEKNRRAAEDAKILDALDQEANAGAIQDETQWDARYNALALPIKDKAAVSVIENDLFPGTSDDLARRIEEAKRRNAELQRSTEEAPPSPSPMPMLSVPDGIASRSRFVSRLPESIPSRIESTIASVIDPVGAYEDAFSKLSSIAKSIESGKSIDDLKSVIKTALSSPESQADFMVDFVALALTRNPRFSNTNLDEAAIASLAAQNAGNSADSKYDPGSILLRAIERINNRTETKPDGLPDSPVEIQKAQGSRYGKGREKKSKN